MSSVFILVDCHEVSQRPVVRFFNGIREEARGKFTVAPVVSQAFAADALAAAGLIGAVASFEVFLTAAFIHARLRSSDFLAKR